MVPGAWLQESKCRLDHFKLMRHFRAPDMSAEVVPAFHLTNLYQKPGTPAVYSWWGRSVYKFMLNELPKTMNEKQGSRRGMGDLWSFAAKYPQMNWANIEDNSWGCGIVWSDGVKCTQTQALPTSWGMWWPVIYVPDCYDTTGTQLMVWCQDQALTGSRPWRTPKQRVIRLRGATQDAVMTPVPVFVAPASPPDYTMSSTVTIEEVEETSEGTHHTVNEDEAEPEEEFEVVQSLSWTMD